MSFLESEYYRLYLVPWRRCGPLQALAVNVRFSEPTAACRKRSVDLDMKRVVSQFRKAKLISVHMSEPCEPLWVT